LLPPEVRF